ncbi:MAG TPA: DUF3617 family protein [Brevundimonas sp.]
MTRRFWIVLAALALAGCGADSAQPPQPGLWEVTRSAGAPSGRQKTSPPTTMCIRDQGREGDPARRIIVDMIGSSRCKPDKVQVAGGRVSGALQCPEFYAFSAHEEPVTGRYSADSVELAVDTPVFGHVLRQSVSAKRIGDCER